MSPGRVRKSVARTRAASGPGTPALLRIWDGVGHGMASGDCEAVLHNTYWLSFLMRRLGLTPAADPC
ncbi:hypothetical protein [Streptomyces axinellae]|uniref:Peptidase S33 tripeptidyl aminopeptidase-like C-terminal domain-containing protein n=1 Tax=Streptomyces axinellae TaxID=552788 RepID=A0ABN3Q6M4_9ACTN